MSPITAVSIWVVAEIVWLTVSMNCIAASHSSPGASSTLFLVSTPRRSTHHRSRLRHYPRYFRVHPDAEMFFRDYTLKFLPTMPTWRDMTVDGAVSLVRYLHLCFIRQLIKPSQDSSIQRFPSMPEGECNRMIAWGLISCKSRGPPSQSELPDTWVPRSCRI